MMKNVVFSLLCLAAFMACSPENIVGNAPRVYDVANSPCKYSLSPTESRVDFYAEHKELPASFSIELHNDGTAQCVLEDVEANCGVKQINVKMVNQDNQITLILYHNVLENLADCFCKYDVKFKIGGLTAGAYQLKVFFAHPDMQYNPSNLVYNGLLNLMLNTKETITFMPDSRLPER